MKSWPRTLGRLTLLATLVLAAALWGGTADAAPARQSGPLVCSWTSLPPLLRQGVYFSAAAYDSGNHTAWFYGGVNQTGQVANTLTALDLSNADPSKASASEPATDGARSQRYGAAGAYRSAGDASALFFIGGAAEDGQGKNDLQMLTIKDAAWRKVNPQGGKQRLFSAAVYIPVHDVILVQGGTRACPLDDSSRQSGDCEADNLGSQFLTFDPMTDEMRWINGPAGGPQNLMGSSLVYDGRAKRVLAFGGSRDNNLAENRVFELDVSDPDLSKASWRALTTDGLPPKARYFHSAAYDANRNMLVVQGGVAQAGLGRSENVLDDTWGLDLTPNPPVWVDLDADFRDLVGAAMVYAPRINRPVMLGGRARFKDRSDTQTTFRDPNGLECGAAPTPTREPTRTVVDPGQPKVCDYLARRVPAAVINDAIANASSVRGFGEPLNPGVPPGPTNPLKTYLGLQNPAVPYHPLFNGVAYKAGCP